MMKKKLLSLTLAACMVLSLAACGSTPAASDTSSDTTSNDAASSTGSGDSDTPAQSFTIGICQLVQHDALDAATQGFQDAVTEALGAENVTFAKNVTFDVQNASGDSATCSTIAGQFVTEGVDLIMANATAALQAATAATGTIPILGTSVTEYGVALGLSDFNGTVGGNVSGTSDLAPLDQQAAMVQELFPDAKNVGLLYCSAEPNSQYQVDTVKGYLEDLGYTCELYSFVDSNDVASVTKTACDSSDVLYIPTDNTAASNTEAINNVAQPAGVPIVAGEEGICKGCGVATLSISYYDLGVATGKMAVKILTGESDISEMPIEYAPNFTKKFNADIAGALGLTIPAGYEAIG